MFAPMQLLALAAALSSANAACVRKGQSSSVDVPASSSTAVASSALAVQASSSSEPTSTVLTSSVAAVASLSAAPEPAASSSSVQEVVATSSTSAQAAVTSSSSAQAYTTAPASSTATTLATVAAAASATAGSAATSTSSASAAGGDTKYLVVFGDSYSSTGFYIEGDKPSASDPFGSPALPGDTTTGGLNWVGYVTSVYNTSTVLTYDWAYYGADVSNDIINTGVTTDVIAQVGDFEANLVPAPSYAEWTADDLLVAVWIGINDIGECFWEVEEYETCPIDEVMAKYFSLMQNLYDDGVRNFVLNMVPPFYKAPAFDAETDLSGLVANLESYNSLLVSNMEEFRTNNSDITLGQVFNTTSYFWEVLDDPTSYGLDSDITCSNSDGTTCVWYDDYHPGQAIHKLVAEGFVSALTGSFF